MSSSAARVVLYARWHKISPCEDQNHEERDNQHEQLQPSKRPRTTVRIAEEKGYFDLNEEDFKVVTRWDEVFKASPEFEKHKNVWVPLSIRLAQWTAETRQRNSSGRTETFYHHPYSPCRLRSIKHVLQFIHFGFIPNNQDGSSSSIPDNSFPPCPKRPRTRKEEVEAFLADAWKNLMNLGSDENQANNSFPPCPKRQRMEKEEVEAFLGDARRNLMNLGLQENHN